MKARELRIGNLVNIQNEGIWQWPSSWFEIYFVDDDSECEAIKPIPLTEEWLLKFGFEKGYLEENSQTIEIRIKRNEFCLAGYDSCTDGMVFSGEIKYVHQLQNLYFALTGKELEIKQPAPSHNQ